MDKKIIESVIKRVQQAEKFVLKELPDICQQIVYEGYIDAYTDLAGTVFAIFTSIVGIPVCLYVFHITPYDTARYSSGEWGVIHIITTVVSVVFVILFFMAFCCLWSNIQQIVYLKKCPKLFLLRQLRKLIR